MYRYYLHTHFLEVLSKKGNIFNTLPVPDGTKIKLLFLQKYILFLSCPKSSEQRSNVPSVFYCFHLDNELLPKISNSFITPMCTHNFKLMLNRIIFTEVLANCDLFRLKVVFLTLEFVQLSNIGTVMYRKCF